MKKVLSRKLVVLIMVGFTYSCASYTCPTYAKYGTDHLGGMEIDQKDVKDQHDHKNLRNSQSI